MAKAFPSLVEENAEKFTLSVNFLRPTGTTRDVLNLGHGASGQAGLVSQYSNILKKYVHKPIQHPVIILCDNDDESVKLFKKANEKREREKEILKETTDPFYHLDENLYLIKVPAHEDKPSMNGSIEKGAIEKGVIENLFQPALLKTTLGKKPFNEKKDHGDESAYGKVVFAEKVVRANAATVDFSGFEELLSRIDQCLTHYKEIVLSNVSA